jgi:ankyrin repeat protein
VTVLLQAGGDSSCTTADSEGKTALLYAANKGHTETVQALLTAGRASMCVAADRQGLTALHVAARRGYIQTVQALLKAGHAVSMCAAEDCWGQTALHYAAAGGHTATVTALLKAGTPNVVVKQVLAACVATARKDVVTAIKHHRRHCSVCDRTAAEVLLCVKCSKAGIRVLYCSKECQARWVCSIWEGTKCIAMGTQVYSVFCFCFAAASAAPHV